MKNWIIYIAFPALLCAACAKEEVAPVQPQAPAETGTYLFTLKANVDSDLTKTTYEEDKTFSWSAGDQISVLFNNGVDNQYFTLTTTDTGASANFSGEIPAGYTIGSSNDENEKVALFPAGAHYYDRTKAKYDATDYPKRGTFFNIPAFTDFTASHFSANLPMAAIGDGDNNFTFKHIAGTYKVVFNSIDASVTKVMLTVKNQLTYAISGDFRLEDGGSHNYCWWQTWTSEGSAAQSVSYVVNVDPSTHKATFYIPYSHNDAAGFQPQLTLTNAVNGNTLRVASAKAAFSGDNKPSFEHMVVLPEIPAPGTGVAPGWRSNHDINWDLVDASTTGRTSTNYAGINLMKVTSDQDNLYILLDIKVDYLLDNDTYDYSNYFIFFAGDGSASGSTHWSWPDDHYQTRIEGWLKTGNALVYTNGTGYILDAIANIDGEHCYYEIAIAREGNSALEGTSAVIACLFDKRYQIGSTVYTDPVVGADPVGYAPASWKPMMSITLPDADEPAPLPANLTFTEAEDDVVNPERGFYKHFEYKFDGSVPSTSIASHTFDEPLVFTLFYLRDYRESDHLPSAVLEKVDAEWAAAKAKGKKVIARFAYTWLDETPHDPSPAQVINHLADLKTTFAKYEDILLVVQAGFIGTYGEWYYKDSDFKWTVSGSTLSNYGNASSVVTKLLEVVPESRQIAFRTPFYKRWYLHPTSINADVDAITSWGTSANQRIGYFNDGFRGSASDVGTFDYGDLDRDWWYNQGEWLVCGGESAYAGKDYDKDGTVTDAEKLQWLDENATLASPVNSIAELKRQHFSYLHNAPTNILMDYWGGSADGGKFSWGGADMIPEIKKSLGYRLVVNSADFTGSSLESGATVNYSISIQNKGCARILYPRPCQLVLIHDGTPVVLKSNLTDVRNLAPGADATILTGSFDLPQAVTRKDKLAIWMPDNAAALQATPAYSIHLANEEVVWENGYNVIYSF